MCVHCVPSLCDFKVQKPYLGSVVQGVLGDIMDLVSFKVQPAGETGFKKGRPGWSGGPGCQEPIVICCAWGSQGSALGIGA